jgi:dihydrodipicolinate synthase/N-acetylneuraminate lyase
MTLGAAIAATVTPLRDGGRAVDADAFEPLYGFYARSGLDGALILGTTGEGILLSHQERRLVAELAVEASGPLSTIVHAGAQTTDETVALASHAAEIGADAVAVIAPPYYPLDEREVLAHFVAAAKACAPLPFYLYEFAARSGYAVPPAVILRIREAAPNLRGLKVSDHPWEKFEQYLIEGLEIYVGPEGLLGRGLQHGAVGAVSGLAGGFPEAVVQATREQTDAATEAAGKLRATVSAFPFQAALKTALAWRGVPVSADVHSPLRGLDSEETGRFRTAFDQAVRDGLVPA